MSMRRGEKVFLNDSIEEFGSVCYHVQTPDVRRDIPENALQCLNEISVDSELRIGDCSSSVTLEFSFRDEKTYLKRMAKINKMIGVLSDMRSDMREGYDDMVERNNESCNQLHKDQDEDWPAPSVVESVVTFDERDCAFRGQLAGDTFLDVGESLEAGDG